MQAGRLWLRVKPRNLLGGNGVSFYVVEGRQTRDEESKVFVLVVFDTKVIYHQDESDGSGRVAKKAGG